MSSSPPPPQPSASSSLAFPGLGPSGASGSPTATSSGSAPPPPPPQQSQSNSNGGAPLSVFAFPSDRLSLQPRQQAPASSGGPPSSGTDPGPTLSADPSMSTSPSSTSSTASSGPSYKPFYANDGGSQPAPFFTFALAAVALFVIVVAFVLLRICVRNRRLRRMGLLPEGGPMERFLGAGGLPAGFGTREPPEDNVVPPKLWEARIVPMAAKNGAGKVAPSPSWNDEISRDEKSAAAASDAGSGWGSLVPMAASLPTSLYVSTGAASGTSPPSSTTAAAAAVAAESGPTSKSSKKKKHNSNAAKSGTEEATAAERTDLDETLPGSVNVSVLIAMPSAPKGDGEELPELMLGTAAVPIYVRAPAKAPDAVSNQDGVVGGNSAPGYFNTPHHASQQQQASVAKNSSNGLRCHPTRAQLLSLFEAAKEAKERVQAPQKEVGDDTDDAEGDADADTDAENDGRRTGGAATTATTSAEQRR
ncbi:unnamed protein product [Jaminaea pallidilutea]